MKKIIFYCLLCTLNFSNTNAQVIDIMSEDEFITQQPEKNSSSSEINSEESTEENETAPSEKKDGIFSFITKPLSLLFSANDEVVSPEGKKETFLEKSIRKANEGNLEDQMNLAYMYLYGTNGVEQNFAEALKYYTMAADQNDPIGLNNLGSLYFNGIGVEKNYIKAIELFNKSAELGNDSAATNLGFIYLTGGKKDSVRNQKAVEMFKKGSANGNNIAKFMLGYAYYKGFVLPKDYYEAFALINSAAKGGAQLDEAQFLLGEMYVNGYGTVQNYSNGVKYYRLAVNQGNTDAYMTLANIYAQGKIFPQNLEMAHSLYNIAASQGIDDADKYRDRIASSLDMEQLLNAQAAAQSFKENPSDLTVYVRQTYGEKIRNYIDINILVPEIKKVKKKKKELQKTAPVENNSTQLL